MKGFARALVEALGAMESRRPDAANRPRPVLDIQPGATREEIRATYKRLAKQCYPDPVAGLGESYVTWPNGE